MDGESIDRHPGERPRKKRHVLLWVFLAVNVLVMFLINADINATVSDACVGVPAAEYELCREVNEYGAGLGLFPLVAALAAVDVLLMAGYGLYWRTLPRARRASPSRPPAG